eukprot:1195168-Prorocentrum_minimum.AAC.7
MGGTDLRPVAARDGLLLLSTRGEASWGASVGAWGDFSFGDELNSEEVSGWLAARADGWELSL